MPPIRNHFPQGAISTLRKADLVTACRLLHLADDGTVDVLRQRLKTYARHHLELRNNPTYAGLFVHMRNQPPPQDPDEEEENEDEDEPGQEEEQQNDDDDDDDDAQYPEFHGIADPQNVPSDIEEEEEEEETDDDNLMDVQWESDSSSSASSVNSRRRRSISPRRLKDKRKKSKKGKSKHHFLLFTITTAALSRIFALWPPSRIRDMSVNLD
ncbi:hypothetical protein BJ165DRAFT_749317 [Panaeolus papilionaceus]|nr:hypothetical protein BJ165DRAFT_749317 [Panaeolus papilionaceus]